jgi:hypothetical protein
MFSRQVSTKEAEEYAEKMGCLFIGELKYESAHESTSWLMQYDGRL